MSGVEQRDISLYQPNIPAQSTLLAENAAAWPIVVMETALAAQRGERFPDALVGKPPGDILLTARYLQHLTREGLAAKIGINPHQMGSLELSSKPGSFHILGRIFAFYGWHFSGWQSQLYLDNLLNYAEAQMCEFTDEIEPSWDTLTPEDVQRATLGEAVALFRIKSRLSTAGLSQRSGIDTKSLTDVERDIRPVGIYTFSHMVLGMGFLRCDWPTQVLYSKALSQIKFIPS